MNQIVSFLIHHPETATLIIFGTPIFLSRYVSQLVEALLRANGKTVSYRELYEGIHGKEWTGEEVTTIKQLVKRLRGRIDAAFPGLGHSLILNHHGSGYRLDQSALETLKRDI